MKNSRVFKVLTKMCSRDSYMTDRLRDNDYVGFSSAGILVLDNGVPDLILEMRDGHSAYSIPGGKRERLEEDPIQTALREYKEEGGTYDLVFWDMKKVLWHASGKYALFIVEKGQSSSILPPHNTHPFTSTLINEYMRKSNMAI